MHSILYIDTNMDMRTHRYVLYICAKKNNPKTILQIDLNRDYPTITMALNRKDIEPLRLFCRLQGYILIDQYDPKLPERMKL